MALEPCRECGERVSTSTDECPECGARFPTTTSAAWHIAAWVVGLVGAASFWVWAC